MLDKLLLSDKGCLILINNVPHFPFFSQFSKSANWVAGFFEVEILHASFTCE